MNIEENKNSDQLYHLHAILIHSGSLDQGHYYCYIRPSLDDVWYKFNDQTVTPVMKHIAFTTGQGGYQSLNYMIDQQTSNTDDLGDLLSQNSHKMPNQDLNNIGEKLVAINT